MNIRNDKRLEKTKKIRDTKRKDNKKIKKQMKTFF